MAVVFSNKDGYIKYIGDNMFVNLIAENCEEALLNGSSWEKEEVAQNTERVVLPALPEPVSQLNAKQMQHIIPSVMRNLRGGGYIKWGREDKKPIWWPEDVVFANVKQRPEQQNAGWYISKNVPFAWSVSLVRVISETCRTSFLFSGY